MGRYNRTLKREDCKRKEKKKKQKKTKEVLQKRRETSSARPAGSRKLKQLLDKNI